MIAYSTLGELKNMKKQFGTFLLGSVLAIAQAPPNPTQSGVKPVSIGETPVYRIEVVARSTKAVNYRHRGGATKINFAGTPLMPGSRGEAKVESKQGYIEIEVEFDDLQPATRLLRRKAVRTILEKSC